MQITFNFKNFEPSEHLKNYARTRFEKLAKYMNNTEHMELLVNLSVEKFRQQAEVVMTGESLKLSANEESEDMYSTIDLVLDKMDAQVRKLREKAKDRRKKGQGTVRADYFTFGEGAPGEREQNIVSSDSYVPKPMSVDEAAMQLDNLQYDFLVFQDAQTERISVIYKRKNGDYGLIDPGM